MDLYDQWAHYCDFVDKWIELFRNKCDMLNFKHSHLSDSFIENEIMGSINNNPEEKAKEFILTNQTNDSTRTLPVHSGEQHRLGLQV